MSIKKKNEVTKIASRYETNRCQWREGQSQCQELGSISSGLGGDNDFFCTWHYYCLENPKSNNYREFCEWLKQNRRWDGIPQKLWQRLTGNYREIEAIAAAKADVELFP